MSRVARRHIDYGLSVWPPFGRFVILAEEDFLECLAEHFVKNRIKNRINHGTGVAQPGDHVDHPRAHVLLAAVAQGWQQVQDEERCPKKDECKEDDAQDFGRLLLQSNDATVS